MLVKGPMLGNSAEADDIQSIVEQYQGLPGALLPLLHAVQARQGYVSSSWVPVIADGLNLSRAEVHGVISFYPDFHRHPRGHHVVQVCRAEACQAMGSRKLEDHAKQVLGVDFGETTEDGKFTLEPVYCLGNCACAPSVRVDNQIFGQVDEALFDQVIAQADQIDGTIMGSVIEESSSYRFYLARDTSALAVHAEAVAQRLQETADGLALEIDLLRTGSRGLFYLEPLLEVDINEQRIGFGPVTPADVDSILSALDTDPSRHPLHLGRVDDLDYLSQQQRVTFARAGLGDPVCLDNYQNLSGFDGLRKALLMTQQDIIDQIAESGLRGRGGAAFPAGIKMQTVLDTASEQKYVVCNADEGDSGTFADRLLMESDPYQLIEGMIIAGLAVGANQGYIYLRSEYPLAHQSLNLAIEQALDAGFLGSDILGSSKEFHLEVRLGAGAYICGEETAMLDSLEGKRGMVRVKPPVPAIQGLFEQPTVVNNVLTLAAMSSILREGSEAYQSMGSGRSRGTLVVQLAGNIKRGGLVEVPFGLTLRALVETYGQGTATGRAMRAIQVGGPLGAFLPESQWDTPLDYEAFTEINAMIGHGGVVVFDDTVNMAEQARFSMEVCAVESCGKCTPCRIGSTRGMEVIDRITSGQARQENMIVLRDLCDTMEAGSLCAMGGMTPFPVRSAIDYFPEDFAGDRA